MTYEDMVYEFHEKFGVPIRLKPGFPSQDRIKLRIALIHEEYLEFLLALQSFDLIKVADALCDLHYVISGTSLEFGLPENTLFEAVHLSNMSKLWKDGKVHYRDDGKILKPETFNEPDLKTIIERFQFINI